MAGKRGLTYTPKYWQELVDGYNRIYKTTFQNRKDMLEQLYAVMSAEEICERLGMCANRFFMAMKEDGVPVKTRKIKNYILGLTPEQLLTKTPQQLFIESGAKDISNVYSIIRWHGLKCKLHPPGRIPKCVLDDWSILDGKTLAEIAAYFEISQPHAGVLARGHGVKCVLLKRGKGVKNGMV